MKHISTALLFSAVAGLSLGAAPLAHAQTTTRFSTVEFKDTTLSDALEMVFQAANNPAHTIDPSASEVPIGAITLQNIQWDSALRTLANQNNFKVSRGADGSYLVEPREPVLQEGSGTDGSSDPRASSGRGRSGGNNVPANPFGGGGFGGRGGARNGASFEMVPSLSTQSNAQLTNPRLGGTDTSGDTKSVQPIIVRHIYVGGIAQLFNNSAIITTDLFVSPSSGSNNNNGGNRGGVQNGGSFGGNTGGFGGSGFGGNTGGFGGNTGGFGGSGFGGNTGGFGGNTGGFGGNTGGFGSF